MVRSKAALIAPWNMIAASDFKDLTLDVIVGQRINSCASDVVEC
jgi:hypothetical protein